MKKEIVHPVKEQAQRNALIVVAQEKRNVELVAQKSNVVNVTEQERLIAQNVMAQERLICHERA